MSGFYAQAVLLGAAFFVAAFALAMARRALDVASAFKTGPRTAEQKRVIARRMRRRAAELEIEAEKVSPSRG